MSLRSLPCLLALCLCTACGEDESLDPEQPDYLPKPVAGSRCGAVVQQHPIEGATHVEACSRVSYATKPPSSGNHYPVWAAFRSYQSAVPYGYLVHALEHGAVVFFHNCSGDCSTQLAELEQMEDSLPADPLCPGPPAPSRRTIITPDPRLDVSFAASAWGFTLRSDCFESGVFRDFYAAHAGRGPESLCAAGEDFSLPDGGLSVAPGCGR